MSDWTTRIQGHRVWELMNSLGPQIDGAVKIEYIDPVALEGLERLRTVLAFCGKRLGGTDPLIMSPVPLDAIAGSLDTAKVEIEAFVKDGTVARVANANVAADAVLGYLAQIPAITTPEELVGLIQAANVSREQFEGQARTSSESRKQADDEINTLKSTLSGFTTQAQTTFGNLQAQLDAERDKISAQLATHQKLFADTQEARSNTYTETLRKIQESLSQTLTDQQRQFSDAQENRNQAFTSAQTDSQKRFGDLIADFTKRLNDQDSEFTRQRDAFIGDSKKRLEDLHQRYLGEADDVLKKVNARREEVEKLVGVIGNLGVTSGYQKAANSARTSMWIWQGAAVLALALVIFFAYHAFLPTIQGDFRWGGFATRVFLTITVGVLAAYAVSQADRFFHMEKHNRKLALELAAIDPLSLYCPRRSNSNSSLR
jgi:hypothetical protein